MGLPADAVTWMRWREDNPDQAEGEVEPERKAQNFNDWKAMLQEEPK